MAVRFLALLVVFLILLPLYCVYYPPGVLIRYFSYHWPDVLFQVPLPKGSEKIIALSIDDAPSAYTKQILAELVVNNAHATFFVVGGQVDEERKGVLKELVRLGNELGNHGMRDEPARSLTLPELEKQIHKVDRIISDAYAAAGKPNQQPKYYRPGSGFFSTGMRELVRKLGHKLVLGGIYPHDAQVPYAWMNARHILGMARPGGIIICHDRRSWTVDMLRKVLPELRRRGYRVVSVGELERAAGG